MGKSKEITDDLLEEALEIKDQLFIQKVHDSLEETRYEKGYKTIQVLLDEPFYTESKGERSKKNTQLRYWKRFFEWENDGRAWIITKIYSIPQVPVKPGPKNELVTLGVDIATKVLNDNRKLNVPGVDYDNFYTTNRTFSRTLGLCTKKFYNGEKHVTPIISRVERELPKEKLKWKNISREDIKRCFVQYTKAARRNTDNVINALKRYHLADYEKIQIIYDIESASMHRAYWHDPDDKEKLVIYHKAAYQFLVENGYDIEKITKSNNLQRCGVNMLKYYKYIDEITEEEGFHLFQGYVLHIIPDNIAAYCKDRQLDEVRIDSLRRQMHDLFCKEEMIKAKETTKEKGGIVVIGENHESMLTKNYSLVCDFIVKNYMSFEPIQDTNKSMGYMPDQVYYLELENEELLDLFEKN